MNCSFLDYVQLLMIGCAIQATKVNQNGKKHGEVTEEYSTDSTIVYWDSAPPKSRKKRKRLLKRKKLPFTKSSSPRSSVSFNFKVSVHGIQHRR